MARCLAAGVGGVALLLAALPGAATPLLIRDARLIDGTGAPPRDHVSILVRDGRIAAIGSDLAAGDAVVLDAAGAAVLPGLIDSHVHFIAAPGGAFRHDSPDALRELNRQHLRAYVACGVTTVLDAGIDPPVARDIQTWLAAGHPGPRFLTTGPYVRPAGGYGWPGFGAETTPAEVEAKLDLISALGGVGIKLAIEAGSNPLASLGGFSPELRTAILDGAARRGLPLYIHATTETAQRAALDWHAHAIMHPVLGGIWTGAFGTPADLSEDFVRRMKASGAYQVSTLSLIDTWPGFYPRERLDDPLVRLTVPAVELATARDAAAERAAVIGIIGFGAPWLPEGLRPLVASYIWTHDTLLDGLRYSQRNLHRLYAAGVPIAVGTDAPSPWPDAIFHFHGPQTLREIELLGEAGIPPMDAIQAATRVPAEMLGLGAEVGTVAVGKRADLVVVAGDPLADLGALRSIRWSVRDGVAHTPQEWMAAP